MRLRKIYTVDPLLIAKGHTKKKKSGRLKAWMVLAAVLLAGAAAAYKGILPDGTDIQISIDAARNYFESCINDLLAQPPWKVFVFFVPALLFDTTRYYLTNTFVFFSSFFTKSSQVESESRGESALVSVLLPAHNEENNIRRTLDSILESTYPNFEIIVVDDFSTDMTQNVCRGYERKGLIKYIRLSIRGGKPAALNHAIKVAKGKYIIHFDAEVVINRNAISEVLKPFKDPAVGVVSGNLRVYNDRESLATRLQAAEYGMGISLQRRWLAMVDSLQISSGAFSALRREVLEQLMGEDPETGDDLDITLKARKSGYKIAFAHKAVAMTNVPNTFGRLFRQRVRWDECYIRLNLRKHGNMADFRKFRIGDFISFISDILFNIVLLMIFPVYIVWVAFYVPHLFLFVLAATYLFYTVVNLWQLVMVVILSDDPPRDVVFILYAPIFFIYSLFLRVPRALAYFLEFFRLGYFRDGFFPKKIWDNMPRY